MTTTTPQPVNEQTDRQAKLQHRNETYTTQAEHDAAPAQLERPVVPVVSVVAALVGERFADCLTNQTVDNRTHTATHQKSDSLFQRQSDFASDNPPLATPPNHGTDLHSHCVKRREVPTTTFASFVPSTKFRYFIFEGEESTTRAKRYHRCRRERTRRIFERP